MVVVVPSPQNIITITGSPSGSETAKFIAAAFPKVTVDEAGLHEEMTGALFVGSSTVIVPHEVCWDDLPLESVAVILTINLPVLE